MGRWNNDMKRFYAPVFAAALASLVITGCSPTVKVAPPTEPITINLNVKVEHEIRIKVEKELDDLFNSDANIF